MTTIRVSRRDRWTTIDRRTINDADLSFKARGILIWLLDKPDGWRVRSADIERHGAEGREAVRAALRELEAAGYMERHRSRGELGRWQTETVVRETPGRTGDGKPSPDTRTSVGRTLFRELGTKTDTHEKSTSCGHREFRNYDDSPLTPEQLAEKYGVEA